MYPKEIISAPVYYYDISPVVPAQSTATRRVRNATISLVPAYDSA